MPKDTIWQCRGCGKTVHAPVKDPLYKLLRHGKLGVNHAKCIRLGWWGEADRKEREHVDTLYGIDDDGTITPVVRP